MFHLIIPPIIISGHQQSPLGWVEVRNPTLAYLDPTCNVSALISSSHLLGSPSWSYSVVWTKFQISELNIIVADRGLNPTYDLCLDLRSSYFQCSYEKPTNFTANYWQQATYNRQQTTGHRYPSSKLLFYNLIGQLRVGLALCFFHDLADKKSK